MSLTPRFNNAPLLPFDVLQEIAQYCDSSTLEAYCSSSHLLREAVVPFFFRASDIRFGVGVSRNAAHIRSNSQSYQAWANKRIEKFEQLSASRYAKYVHTLSYIGADPYLYPESPDSDADGMLYLDAAHHAAIWPIFKRNLSQYVQLTNLLLRYVSIDDEAIIAIGTLQNLQDFSLEYLTFSCSMELAMHHNVLPSKCLTYWPLFDLDNGRDSDIGAVFIAGACSKIKSLQTDAMGKDGPQDNLYHILNNCPLLEQLMIVMSNGGDTAVADRPTKGLDSTALPRLWSYHGPDFYASAMIKGRPVHKIHLYPCPYDLDDTNVTRWFKDTFSETTIAVRSFTVQFVPQIAVNGLLRVILTTLPSLEELVVEVEGSFGEKELDCLVDDLSIGVCAIPASLKSLSLRWKYRDASITYQVLWKGLRKMLAMPEKLNNLEYLAIGIISPTYIICERSKERPGEWTIR